MVANTTVVAIVVSWLGLALVPPLALAAGDDDSAYTTTTPSPAAVEAGLKIKRDERIATVVGELRNIVDNFGPDAVVLQVKLMMKSLAAGAMNPTQVRVVGPTSESGEAGESDETLLFIDTNTGLLFDRAAVTDETIEDTIWDDIAGAALAEMESFDIKPKGLKLRFTFGLQDTSSFPQPIPDSDSDFESDQLTFSLSSSALEELLGGQTTIEELRNPSRAAAR